jgi:hypothetical protein
MELRLLAVGRVPSRGALFWFLNRLLSTSKKGDVDKSILTALACLSRKTLDEFSLNSRHVRLSFAI